MIKFAVILYFICFVLYIFFSRQPDYFDGLRTRGTVHFIKDSAHTTKQPYVFFVDDKKTDSFNAAYLFKSFKEGQTVPVIYESSNPQNAGIYSLWGYWFRWGELLFSIIVLTVGLFATISITSNPTPEALIEQLEDKPRKRRKYDL